jgi:hypothetical protein
MGVTEFYGARSPCLLKAQLLGRFQEGEQIGEFLAA